MASLQASWSTPDPISGPNVNDPQIAVDAAGNATAVWTSISGPNSIIQSATKPFGGSWSGTDILTDTGQDASLPQIAVDAAGNATAVWLRFYGTNNVVYAKTKKFGESWSVDPVGLSDPEHAANSPQIAVGAAGVAIAVWQTSNGANSIIQAATKPFEEIWQAPVTISALGYDADSPEIAVDADGNATAVWTSTSGPVSNIQSSTKPFGESWLGPVILSGSGLSAATPQIAVDAARNVTVVWQKFDGNYVIQASTKLFGESWQSLENISDSAPLLAQGPQIAVDAAGNATAVWIQSDGTHGIVQASTKLFGESWPIDPDNNLSAPELDADAPQIAVDAAGNATVVWKVHNGIYDIVQATTKPYMGSWPVDPVDLSDLVGSSFVPQIAVDAAGNATAVWRLFGSAGAIQSSTQYVAPTVTSVVPNSGLPAGGTSVTITGTTFVGVIAVNFGSVIAPNFTVVSPTEIIAIAPAGSPGTVDIQVEAAGGFSPITDADRYQYTSQPSVPRPPRHFRGTNKKRHHSHKHKYVLRSNWEVSPSTDTSAYRLYKRNKIVATIPSNSKRFFKTHLIWKHSWKKFSITAVTENNVESVHKKLKIGH